MDAEQGHVHRRGRRTLRACTLMVMMVTQSVLAAACLLHALYACMGVQASENEVHIQFDVISDITGNTTLQFKNIRTRKLMDLVDEKRSKIYVRCTGPYILFMDLCYKSLERQASGTLTLQVEGRKTPLSSFNLSFSEESCKTLQSMVSLSAHEEAVLRLSSKGLFKIKNVTVSLSSLLGSRCEF